MTTSPRLTAPLTLLLVTLLLGLSACGEDGVFVDEPGLHDASGTPSEDASAEASADAGLPDASQPDASQPDANLPDAGSPDAAEDYTPRSVFEHGPYRVGFRAFSLTYDAIGEADRQLRVAVWYPTTDLDGLKGRYANLLGRPEVFANASVALDSPMPLLVFSHGNGALAEQSYFMMEFFASHGWVVAAPEHTGNTFRETSGIDLSTAPLRPQDITAVIDTMLDRPADDPLHGRVDDARIVASGHSFGGFTTLALAGASFAVDEVLRDCEAGLLDYSLCMTFEGEELDAFRAGFHDPRIKLAIPQTPAGADAFREGLAEITIPTMLMTAGQDDMLPNEEEGDRIWALMDGSAAHVRVDLHRGAHLTYSNICEHMASLVPEDCSEDLIPPELAYDIINAYTLAFARYHLDDDPAVADLITGVDEPWPGEVIYSTR